MTARFANTPRKRISFDFFSSNKIPKKKLKATERSKTDK